MIGAGTLSSRDRKTAIIGGTIVLSLLLVFKGIPAWRSWVQDARASAVELQVAVAKARASGSRGNMLDTVEARQTRHLALHRTVLDGDTPAHAGAVLASLVSETAELSGVQIGTVEIRVDSQAVSNTTTAANTAARLVHVGVRTTLTGDVQGITTFAHRIESSTAPLLAIRSFALTQPEPGAAVTQPEALRVEILIEGLAWRSTEP